jgi:predicted ABC-type sugar transport system permease subunit
MGNGNFGSISWVVVVILVAFVVAGSFYFRRRSR